MQSRQTDDLAIEDVTHATAHNRCLRIINHSGPDVPVPQQFLDGSDIVASLQKMSSKAVAHGVAARGLGDFPLADCLFHRFLNDGFMQMVAPGDA